MKEMTIEQKAKAYDEALKKARNIVNSINVGLIGKDSFIAVFPVLKESEDEKIMKSLKILLQHFCNGYRVPGLDFPVSYKDMLAWLEKQGEQKTVDEIAKEVSKNKTLAIAFLKSAGIINEKGELSEQYRQEGQKPAEEHNITGIGSKSAQGKLGEMIKNLKPINEVLEHDSAWSEKYIADVFEKVGLAKIAREQGNENLSSALQSALIELGKFIPQPKQEWSEEDEKVLDGVITNYESGYLPSVEKRDEIIEKLKSLKERYTWKPSDEQMEGIECTIKTLRYQLNAGDNRLDSLYNDLKKLRKG